MRVSTPEAAELTKLLENIFRSVNIALVNEMAMLTDRMGIDIWEVVDAAATKPYGFMRFEPGPGMGGHCLPVDPFYLTWRAREFDLATEFIELAGKVNQQMPYYCVEQGRARAQRRRQAGPRRADRRLGVSYKAGVGDMRESPALKILALLASGRRRRLPRPARAGAFSCRPVRARARRARRSDPSSSGRAPGRGAAKRPRRGHPPASRASEAGSSAA